MGAMTGLLVGDALGVPYEFHEPSTLPLPEEIEFNPPRGFDRAHLGVPAGTWSDDGAQALCLLASLLACRRFDAEDFDSRLVRWQGEGYMAVDGRVFDIGITTGQALRAIKSGVPAPTTSPASPMDTYAPRSAAPCTASGPGAFWRRQQHRGTRPQKHCEFSIGAMISGAPGRRGKS